jgi:hypothetical protein
MGEGANSNAFGLKLPFKRRAIVDPRRREGRAGKQRRDVRAGE